MRDILLRNTYQRQYLAEPLYAGDGGYRLCLNYGKDVSGAHVELLAQRSDGTIVSLSGETEGSYVYGHIQASALSVAGGILFRMQIIDDESVTTVIEAEGVVQEMWDTDTVTADDNYPILTSLIKEVRDLKNEVAAFDSQYLKARYIWYANKDAVALASNPYVKVGSIADFKTNGEVFVIMSAISVLYGVIAVDLSATTVAPSVVVGGYELYNNGDLLIYGGNFLGVEVWKRMPMHEAKTNLDGLMSASDKVNLNTLLNANNLKVYNHATELTADWTDGYLVNWCRDTGLYLGGIAEGCGGHPPVVNNNNTSWALLTLNGTYSDGFCPHRLQIAFDLSNCLLYLRKGWQSSGTWADWVAV